MSMARKRFRMKTLSSDAPKTCEHGERGFLEPKSPMVQPNPSRRASEKVLKGERASEKDRTEGVGSVIEG